MPSREGVHRKDIGLQDAVHVERNERGVVVTVMTDKMLFAPGQADSAARANWTLLNAVGGVMQQAVPQNPIRVEGHTDSLPIHTARFPSNWELSVTRATTVLRYFEGARHQRSSRLEAGWLRRPAPPGHGQRLGYPPRPQPPRRDRHPPPILMTLKIVTVEQPRPE